MKEGQFSQPPIQPNAVPGTNTPGATGAPGVPQDQTLSPGRSFELGRRGPLTWSPQRLVDATLPYSEWVKKNPGKTKWEHTRERQKALGGYSWLEMAMMPRELRILFNRQRRF